MKIVGLRMLFGLLMPVVLVSAAFGQTEQRDLRPRNCSINGRVTINGQPAANAQVLLFELPADRRQPLPQLQTANGAISRTAFKARADAGGAYRFADLPPGRYTIRPASGAFVNADGSRTGDGARVLTLDAGEARENVDFTLQRGGVVTGRVTDAEGRPVIAQHVNLMRFRQLPDGKRAYHEEGRQGGFSRTDDRGVYRIYGLPAGTYLVSAGGGDDFDVAVKYPRTFYPDAADAEHAKAIEVTLGGVVSDINFRLRSGGKTFEAVGRVVEATTGKPVANVNVSVSKILSNEAHNAGDDEGNGSYARTDRQGNFRLTGLGNGKFRAGIYPEWREQLEHYAEPLTFEITGGNLSGIEIKAVRGSIVSGALVVEGANDPAIKSKFSQVTIFANTDRDESLEQPSSHHNVLARPDGTFQLTGVAPGKLRINAHSPQENALYFVRLERGGVEIKEVIELSPGENISDLHLVFSVGSGVIRGVVKFAGVTASVETRYFVRVNLPNARVRLGVGAEVDEKGRFELARIPGGEYDLELIGNSRNSFGGYEQKTLAKQRVTVTPGAEVQVTLTADPNRKVQEERQ